MALSRTIIEFLNASRHPLPPVTDPDEPLHLDSLAVLRLTAFLDNDCGIPIDDEDITLENFESLRRLEHLIASKSQAGEIEQRP